MFGSIISGIANAVGSVLGFGGSSSSGSSTSDLQNLMDQQKAMYQQQQAFEMQSQMLQSSHDTAMSIIKSIAS